MTLNKSEFVKLEHTCEDAWRAGDWPELERLSLVAVQTSDPRVHPRWSIQKAAQRYLGSIIAFRQFIPPGPEALEREVLRAKVDDLRDWLASRPDLRMVLSAEFQAVDELFLLLGTESSVMNRTRFASRLRRLARPDLAILIATDVLSEGSSLNYYALTVRGAARSDLEMWDEAIRDLTAAAKHPPRDHAVPTYLALSRAHRGRFRASGDLDDGHEALSYAEMAWDLEPSQMSAQSYHAAAQSLGDRGAIELATRALASVEPLEAFGDADLADVALDALLADQPDGGEPAE